MQRAEQEKRVELPQKELPRSANYVARLVDLSPESLDISKPFTTSSEKLAITPDAYKVLDKVSSVDSSLYWLAQEKDGKLDYDAQMRVFTESWAQAIRSKYERFEGEREAMDEMQRRRLEGNLDVLDKLGLSVSEIDAQGIREFYDRYFANGRNTQQFISDIKNSFSKDQIRENIDTFQFVAEMFDTETAQDIAGILLLEAEDYKKGFVEKVNKQAMVTNKKEQQRLTKLARYRHPIKTDVKNKPDILKVDEEQQVKVLDSSGESRPEDGKISIRADDPDGKVLDPKDDIEAMQKRIDLRRADESTQTKAEDSVKIHDAFGSGQVEADVQSVPEIKWDVPIRIPGFGEALPLNMESIPENSRLVGDDNDPLKIVVAESVLSRANEDLRTRSWESGRFIEQAGFFIGRVNSSPDGVLWSEVLEYVPARGSIDQSGGHFTINADVWRNLRDELDKMRLLRGDQNLIAIGWAHTHPRGWEGKMSTADETVNESFDIAGQFAYVFGAGQGQHVPLEVSGNEMTDNHSFFSKGGAGREFGSYKKHTGIRLIPDNVKI